MIPAIGEALLDPNVGVALFVSALGVMTVISAVTLVPLLISDVGVFLAGSVTIRGS